MHLTTLAYYPVDTDSRYNTRKDYDNLWQLAGQLELVGRITTTYVNCHYFINLLLPTLLLFHAAC